MKKRAKIITTIASLCLAVALMAFGVYAAHMVTFDVTTKVNFAVTDVFVSVTGRVYGSASANGGGQDDYEFDTYEDASYEEGSWLEEGNDAPIDPNEATTALEAWDIGELEMSSALPYIIYEITVSNDAGLPISVNVAEKNDTGTFSGANNMAFDKLAYTTDTTPAGSDQITTHATSPSLTCSNLPVGSSVTFVYVAHIIDVIQDIDSFDINIDVSITQYVDQE